MKTFSLDFHPLCSLNVNKKYFAKKRQKIWPKLRILEKKLIFLKQYRLLEKESKNWYVIESQNVKHTEL